MTAVLRRAGPADTEALCALLAASYDGNPKARPEILRWQYWDNPFGQARSWVAEVGGEVVSHWAAVPVPLRVDGRNVVAAKGVDIATHPAHRRQGLFSEVARALLDDCRDGGVEVLLTHPNPESAAAVERAGAVLIGQARAHVRPLDAAWLARRLHLPRSMARLGSGLAFPPVGAPAAGGIGRAAVLDAPPRGIADLWHRVQVHHQTGVARGAAWWAWRYGQRPGGGYHYLATGRGGTLTGAAVCTVAERYGGRFALVCELLACDGAAARVLGQGISDVARAQGAAGVAAVALPDDRQGAMLAAAGLRRLPRRLEPRPLRVMVATPGGGARALAAGGWSMSWGDLDHL